MRRPRLTYANVMSTIGVFIALGGSSYAVTQLPRNSVGERQLKPNAVSGAKVRDASIGRADLAGDAVVAGPRGPRGAAGETGAPGAPGPKGDAGTPGERGPSEVYTISKAANTTMHPTGGVRTNVLSLASLPAGDYLVRLNANAYLGAVDGLYVVCTVTVDGTDLGVAGIVVGQASNATQEGPLSLETTIERASPFTITLQCWQDKNAGANPAALVVRPRLIAERVGDVITK